ncbi:hypothetical protein LJC23_04285 [Desulfovibrio sp. OttesenSCG-928-I05]|nr:hypothetical protein [Desulfovibrio sp. OttesenSCG-928-I05]
MAEKTKHAKNAAAGAALCKPTLLVNTGIGVWKYSEAGVAREQVTDEGFFAEAFEKFGMRSGDIVLVNAGNGESFMVGV